MLPHYYPLPLPDNDGVCEENNCNKAAMTMMAARTTAAMATLPDDSCNEVIVVGHGSNDGNRAVATGILMLRDMSSQFRSESSQSYPLPVNDVFNTQSMHIPRNVESVIDVWQRLTFWAL
jgi:hypothetical protein